MGGPNRRRRRSNLAALFENELARPAFVSRLLYQRCDGVPELPLLGSVPLTSKQWMPAVLKRGPLPELTAEQKRAAVEALLEATRATRGAAQIH